MSDAEKRMKDRKELDELFKAIEPAKNENIARRAIALAEYYIVKAENQAKHIRDLEARNARSERKRGCWVDEEIIRGIAERHCSECGQLMTTAANVRMNFCPNCGAQMLETEGCQRGFTCHRGYKCMCFQCGEEDCERYQSEPPDLTDSLEDELFGQFEKAMKGEKDEQSD